MTPSRTLSARQESGGTHVDAGEPIALLELDGLEAALGPGDVTREGCRVKSRSKLTSSFAQSSSEVRSSAIKGVVDGVGFIG